jgi:hypothetical protein
MRGPVATVTLYLPDGLGTRYAAEVLTSKRRRIVHMDCILANVVEILA